MPLAELHVGDVGITFLLTLRDKTNSALDISDATSKILRLKKPDGSVVEKTMEFATDGKDGKVRYTTVAGDLDLAGVWKRQVIVSFSGGDVWHSNINEFVVNENIE